MSVTKVYKTRVEFCYKEIQTDEIFVCSSLSKIRKRCKVYERNHLVAQQTIKKYKDKTEYKRRLLCANYKCKALNTISGMLNQPIFTGIVEIPITTN